MHLLHSRFVRDLQMVAPALAENQLIPLMTHFWFTGRELMAFNGQVGLAIPFEQDEIKGAVPVSLLELVKIGDHADGTEIELKAAKHTLTATTNRSRAQLPLLAPKFQFKMPRPRDSNRGGNGEEIGELAVAIEHCLASVGVDTSVPEYLGVTLKDEGDHTGVYSCDSGATMSRAYAPAALAEHTTHAILPQAFCQQLVRLYGEHRERLAQLIEQIKAADDGERKTKLKRRLADLKADLSFEISERPDKTGEPVRYALFVAGPVVLYGELLNTRSPLPFVETLRYILADGLKHLVPVPVGLQSALERASIVCDDKRRHTALTVTAGKLRLQSKTDTEEVKDEMLIGRDQADAEVRIYSKLLRRGAGFDRLTIQRRCVAFTKGDRSDTVYAVSCDPPKRDDS